jgi:hypothetical protein
MTIWCLKDSAVWIWCSCDIIVFSGWILKSCDHLLAIYSKKFVFTKYYQKIAGFAFSNNEAFLYEHWYNLFFRFLPV